MSLGISCLITDDAEQAQGMAQRLHELNQERRSIEADMQDIANIALDDFNVEGCYSLSIYDESWHQGVIGILASRIKERHHRPVIAFARAGDNHVGILKGSGRSIKGLHLRDALDLLSKRHPDLLIKFGGHAMAAGLSIEEKNFERFNTEFESIVSSLLTAADLESTLEVDGALELQDMHWEMATALERQVWGQGFPQPAFFDEFAVRDQRIVGEKHLKLTLEKEGRPISAIYFQQQELLPKRIFAVYQLQTNQYNGVQSIQLNIRHWLPTA
jgi:single-stranded-DNA-specific exonuclease